MSENSNSTIIRTISISKEHDSFLKNHREINFSEICRKTIDGLMQSHSEERKPTVNDYAI